MPNAEALGREFAEWIGVKYCMPVNSGTASLHCAVAGIGVGPGDEVIVPAFTFIASALAVLHQNAIPVFADVDPDTYVIDPTIVEERITEKTRAIMAVHIHGLPADMDTVNEIARRHRLKVVEDSAQAYGSLYKGRKTGALGDAAGFAMTTTKQLMAGEGGLMTTDSAEVRERAGMLRMFGERGGPGVATDRPYLTEIVGWNYKIPEMSSALARVRLRHLDEYIAATQRNAAHLTRRLEQIAGVKPPTVPPDRTHPYYMYPVQVNPSEVAARPPN